MVIRRVGAKYVLYTKKKDRQTGRRKRLGVFRSREAALRRERQIQFFKHSR